MKNTKTNNTNYSSRVGKLLAADDHCIIYVGFFGIAKADTLTYKVKGVCHISE